MTSPRIRFLVHSSSAEDERNNRWFPYGNAEDFDTNLAMILVILVCSLAGVLALNACIRCYMRRHEEAEAAGGRMPETEVAKMSSRAPAAVSVPTLVYSAGMKLAGAESECAICLSEFVNGERVRVLPKCNHGFHEKCIEGWLASKPSCPTCRRSCLSPDRDVAGGNETVTRAPPEAMAEP